MPIRLMDPSSASTPAQGSGLASAQGPGLGPSGMAARLSQMAGTLMDQRIHHHHPRHHATGSSASASSLPPPPPTSNNTNGGNGNPASNALIAQLLDMGFPPSWCVRAMEATKNDVDAALSWILLHGEDMANDDQESGGGEGIDPTSGGVGSTDRKSARAGSMSSNDDGPPSLITLNQLNPLSAVSGSSKVKEDLTCTAVNGGFPSVGCRGFAVSSGKWYYELKVHTAGCVQVGWVDCAYDGGADTGQGVGDDGHSWAYDGWRMYLWHEVSAEWGARWSPGDVVGCALNLDTRPCTMSFYLNGCGEEIDMGEAPFVDIDFCGGLYPCVSFNRGEMIQFNFGDSSFAFGPPEGYQPYSDHIKNVVESSYALSELIHDPLMRNLVTLSVPCDAEPQDGGHDAPEWHGGYPSPQQGLGQGSGGALGGNGDGGGGCSYGYSYGISSGSHRRGNELGHDETLMSPFGRGYPSSSSTSSSPRSILATTAAHQVTACFLEDATEEAMGDREFLWTRRYFPQDESSSSGQSRQRSSDRPGVFPTPHLPPLSQISIRDRKTLLQHLTMTSRDLCILYARFAVLRVLRAFPRLAGKKETLLSMLLVSRAIGNRSSGPVTEVGVDTPPPPPPASKQNSSPGASSGPSSVPSPDSCASPYLIDLVLRLVRLCSVASQRTKIYLQTVQLLPSAASSGLPASLGSVLSTGGAPLLEDLRPALVELVATARRLGLGPGLAGAGTGLDAEQGPENAIHSTPIESSPMSQLVRCMLDHIQLDCTNMTRRDLAAEWRLEGGFAPTIFKDRALLDRASLTLPSPALAVWFTTVLLGQNQSNTKGVAGSGTVLTLPNPPSTPLAMESSVMESLCTSWCLALRSPNMAVKTCVMRVLSGILQTKSSSSLSLMSSLPSPLIPYAQRLQVKKRVALSRLSSQRCHTFNHMILLGSSAQ